MPPSGKLVPSPALAKIEHAQTHWDHLLHSAPRGLLKPIDAPLLERLAVALAIAQDATEKLASTGLLVKTPTGYPVQSPYLAIVNRQSDIARKLAAELGIAVTSRARLSLPEALAGSEDAARYFQ